MKIDYPLISIIMPTLNSAKTIGLSLESVARQTYPKNKIEIFVIDGGSKDKTTQIAQKYGATVLPNPKVQPEHAKSIGLKTAKGEYAMFLDSDEVISNPNSLINKVNLLQQNKSCKNIVTTGLLSPKGYPFLCDYINKLGDPFSFFIYRVDSGNFFESLKNKYKVIASTKESEIIGFNNDDLTPIVDGGGHMFDLGYLKSIEDTNDSNLSARVFSSMVFHTHSLGVLKNDFITHYSSPGILGYLRKIKWRIISNLSSRNNNIPGYKNREQYLSKLAKLKKFLFIPYALLLLPSIFDALYLVIKNKDIRYLIHVLISFYTALEIIIQSIIFLLFGGSRFAGAYGS
jgi:glycosyltransferase involved in cell wall biosynthesis